MYDVKRYIKHSFNSFHYDNEDELRRDRDLLTAIDSIEYITKKNGRPYAKTEDNIVSNVGCFVRHDRGYRWLDVHGAKPCDMWSSHKVATFDARKSLDELKKDISDYRKYLVREIESEEKAVNMTYEDFIKELSK